MRRARPLAELVLAFTAAFAPGAGLAQECVGLPTGALGIMTIGFEGTDGATGHGLAFARQSSSRALVLQYKSLEAFTVVDRVRLATAQFSHRLKGTRLPVCLLLGAEFNWYDNDRLERISWSSDDPDYTTEHIRTDGFYGRERIPFGISFGKQFDVRGRFSVVPHFAALLVGEHEAYAPKNTPHESRLSFGSGAAGGLTIATSWLVINSTVSHSRTHARALSKRHNFPFLSVHAGVRF